MSVQPFATYNTATSLANLESKFLNMTNPGNLSINEFLLFPSFLFRRKCDFPFQEMNDHIYLRVQSLNLTNLNIIPFLLICVFFSILLLDICVIFF